MLDKSTEEESQAPELSLGLQSLLAQVGDAGRHAVLNALNAVFAISHLRFQLSRTEAFQQRRGGVQSQGDVLRRRDQQVLRFRDRPWKTGEM